MPERRRSAFAPPSGADRRDCRKLWQKAFNCDAIATKSDAEPDSRSFWHVHGVRVAKDTRFKAGNAPESRVSG